MRQISFVKMHGIGNDFILVRPSAADDVDDHSALARRICDRHFGIGSDGLVLVQDSSVADFRMRMLNPDGSEAQMCGNGIRCFARYVYDRGMTSRTELQVETLAGIKEVKLNLTNGLVDSVRVNMGAPVFDPERIPALIRQPKVKDYPLNVDEVVYPISSVSMGNPHTVVFLSEGQVNTLDLVSLGPKFEHHALFPERTNTEFCSVLDRQTVRMRVWERGAGETLACGTGACASAVVAMDHGLVDDKVSLLLDGGTLEIEWAGNDNTVYMSGTASYVFEGNYFL